MKRAVLLVTLLSFTALAADPPKDAPTVADVTPLDGKLCLSPEDELLLAKHIARVETENAELKKGPALPTWALVLIGVGVTGAAFAAGYGVAKATTK